MAKRVWQCDTCHGTGDTKPWLCPGCGKETCDVCFHIYAHCKTCCTKAWVTIAEKTGEVGPYHAAARQAEEELRLAANSAGWEFDS